MEERERYREKTPLERRLFYSANKKEMIADLRVMENKDFLAKWLVSRQQISHLKNDPLWLSATAKTAASPKPSTNGMPPMPAFSDQWAAAVQIEWFITYRSLKSKGG